MDTNEVYGSSGKHMANVSTSYLQEMVHSTRVSTEDRLAWQQGSVKDLIN